MSFDLVALWTGRILLISLAWALVSLILWLSWTYLFRYVLVFRFATFMWITQKAGRSEEFKEIHTFGWKPRVFEFREITPSQEPKRKNGVEND